MKKKNPNLNQKSDQPLLAVSMGDPAGIGPELCLHVLVNHQVLSSCIPLVFGDAALLKHVASASGILFPDIEILDISSWQSASLKKPAIVDLKNLDLDSVKPGKMDPKCGKAAFEYIEAAVNGALNGPIHGIVTAPINKKTLNDAKIPFAGHTDMLAEMTDAESVCMMMTSEKICVSLVTMHIPHCSVPQNLSRERILEIIRLSNHAISTLKNKKPAITVCALNPHGGENGLFGNEENEIIQPAISQAIAEGFCVRGPVPPDTAFTLKQREQTDVYVAMYHDQGLIPFKMLAFDEGVNLTLGLPFVRTSPDHGTAFDIAWQGKASSLSMIQSILLAVRLISC